jgi:hypothetical protein
MAKFDKCKESYAFNFCNDHDVLTPRNTGWKKYVHTAISINLYDIYNGSMYTIRTSF